MDGAAVSHVLPDGKLKPHELTAGAKVSEGRVTYPGTRTLFDDDESE